MDLNQDNERNLHQHDENMDEQQEHLQENHQEESYQKESIKDDLLQEAKINQDYDEKRNSQEEEIQEGGDNYSSPRGDIDYSQDNTRPVPREERRQTEYMYQGGSAYESREQRPEKRKKRFSAFSLIAVMIIFTFLGTSLGVYSAYNVLPGTSFFENSKLGKLIGEKEGLVQKVFTPSLSSEGLTIPEIVRKVLPAVVTVAVKVPSQGDLFNPQAGYSENIGTGFILNENGLIATNYHVVQAGEDVTVTLYTGEEVSAKVVNFDATNDIAVLQMDVNTKVPGVVELGDSENLQVGEAVVAIGNPLSKEFAGTVTNGIVSATERKVSVSNTEYSYIQTNAAINGGNSGGPLINANGKVIGINSAKISSDSVEGIGFAIPINVLVRDLDSLSKAQLIIGIAGREVTDNMSTQTEMPMGVLVVEVQADSPAYMSALIVGDVITEFDGQKVSSIQDINDLKKAKSAGDVVILKIYRDGEYLDLNLTLREK